ncbi:hypothetical protein F5148DRAFT_1299468 [Russula earlei]|uniref:Uncharacterized protein n=1 Tax=Russula earlei TaxID=71964 RepID=A0ACC0UA46_9AGAM|nr:hypothetical protein F5148DRAFT_1299468 [Russula earlei]
MNSADANEVISSKLYTMKKADEAALPTPVSSSPSSSLSPLHSWRGLRDFLMTQVDPELSTVPLAGYCFMTGWIDAISFSAIFVWCAFQTGNSVQLALAIARLFQGSPGHRDTSFHLADKQALTSLTTFLFGAFIGRIGDRIGAKTRAWLFLGTFIQALFTMAAAISLWKSGQGSVASDRAVPAWSSAGTYACLGLISASMGLQGIMGKRVNTQFATTIVLTTVWCELMADPKLFVTRRVASRDHKIIAVTALFVGGFCSRAILQSIGSPASLGICTGLRVLIALSWFFVPARQASDPRKP